MFQWKMCSFFILMHAVCAVVGYLATYWNRIILPERCRDASLDDSNVYRTMMRSAGSWSSIGLVIQMMMQWYSWRHVVVLSDQRPDISICSYGANTITSWLSSAQSIAANYSVYRIPMSDNPSSDDIDFYLDTVHQKARGKFLCYFESVKPNR
jgi:Receptor family ligand binding region